MATWGSYFASYVKKSDVSIPGGVEEVNDITKSGVRQPVEIKSTAPISVTSNTTSKRSNSSSTVKKLYEIPTEFPKDIPQRSTSNAARVAKLFGYASGNANAAQAKSKLGAVAEQAASMEKQREEIKKADTAVSSLFVKGLRESLGSSVVVDSQTSEIVIGLPPDLFANATIVEAEVSTEKRKNPVAVLDVKEMVTSKLLTASSPDRGPQTQGNGQLNLVSQLVSSKSLVQPPILDPSPKPPVEIKKSIVSSLDSTVPKSTATKNTLNIGNGVQNMLDSFASAASESPTSKTDLLSSKQPETASLQNTKSEVQKLTNEKAKNDTQAMLDLFASQAQDLDSVEDMFNEVPVLVKPKPETRTKPSPSSSRKESLGMLDFFASQAEIVSTSSAPAANLKTPPYSPPDLARAKKPSLSGRVSQPSNAERNLPTPSRRNKSLELLDFFASQAMSTISEDKPLSQQTKTKTMTLEVLPEDSPFAEEQKLTVVPETKSPSKWRLAMPKIQKRTKTDNMNGAPSAPVVVGSPIKTGASLASQSLTIPTDLNLKAAPPLRRRSGTTVVEPRAAPVRPTRANTTPSKASFDIRTETDTQEEEEEAAIDFRERFLEYERQAEKIRLEKEQMEEEQIRMLEEISMFQKEANRIAEEEEAMRKFVESLEGERARDEENESRKRREREARLEAERIERERIENERLERERLVREEEERLRREEVERIRLEEVAAERLLAMAAEKASLKKVEAERVLAQVAEKEKREREVRDAKERLSMEEEARKKKETEDSRRRKMEARMEEERLAMEEVERLNAEMLRYAEEAEADRRLMEDELEQEEFERLENERLEEEERLSRERRRYQEEQEEFERQRDEEERFARQERRKAREETERLQYEKEAAEEEARYYEEERRAELARKRKEEEAYYAEQDRLAAEAARQAEMLDDDSESEDEIVKAERKIKEAFAGLAKERGQTPAQVQAVAPMKRANTAQTNMQRQQDRGPMIRRQEADARVSRNNTVGARPLLPRKDQPIMRGETTRGRPQIRGGLPSGPRRRE